MRTSLEQTVLDSIRRSRMLSPGDRVGVAVSGGADSVALLQILQNLRDDLGITIFVVHFNHQLRGAEADADADFVAALTKKSRLEIVMAREDVAQAAREHGWNIEDAARRLRYGFFQRVINEGRATRIAVAHTADDQAETVLAHLFRGTGLKGLGGIHPQVDSIIRPLLGIRREELRNFLRDSGQSWREDATNRDTRRLRARIREKLLPLVEGDFSPAIVGHLNELARFAREEEAFWAALVEDCFQAHSQKNDEAVSISIPDLLAPLGPLPQFRAPFGQGSDSVSSRPLTERLIRRLYQEMRGDCLGFSADHVEQVIHLAAKSSSGKRVELPGRIVVDRVFSDLIFSLQENAVRGASHLVTAPHQNAYQYCVNLPDRGAITVSIRELGTSFRLKVIDWPTAERDTKRDGEVLDAALLRKPLILRNWRPGDAYRPYGRRLPRKLKQMFLAARVAGPERAAWPVLESGGQVIWARGMPAAEDFCAGKGTQRGLLIEEDRF
jgi:tRNA(Ile)-lysidine synthase